VLVPTLLVFTGFFSLFLDLKRDARALVDARVGPEQQQRIQDRANREMDLDTIIAARRRASTNRPIPGYEKFTFVKRLSVALSKARRNSERPTTEHPESKSSSLG
jgi:hypothetical protein